MAYSIRKAVVICVLAAAGALACAAAAPAATQPALSPSDVQAVRLCGVPAPGRSACLALGLVPRPGRSLPGARRLRASRLGAAPAAAPSPEVIENPNPLAPLTPSYLRSAYGVSGTPEPAATQTIAIVDAYDDPTAEADLAHFSSQFGLPPCTEKEGCFKKLNQAGKASPLPSVEKGWALEIATDVETVHSVCPSCHILLIEAASNSDENLFEAEETAASHGATEITNSWGGGEPASDSPAFNHPHIVITASAGDYGYDNWLIESEGEADYPASSPHVVAVGGTRLAQTAGKWEGENVWNDGGEEEGVKTGYGAGGGGCSPFFSAPTWQSSVAGWAAIGCSGNRAVADVAADADPLTGVNVYDTTGWSGSKAEEKGWAVLGGTSVASPMIASVFALAGGAGGVEYPARTLYEHIGSSGLHDVTAGSNGECLKPLSENGIAACSAAEEANSCSGQGICLARSGYDGPTGVGSPNGIAAFKPGAGGKEEGAAKAGPGGGSGASPATGQPTLAPPHSSPSAPAPTPTVRLARVSALALTRGAIIALNRLRPRVSALSYAFALSAPAQVRITLSRWTRVRRHRRWVTIARPIVLAAAPGRVSGRLSGTRTITSGRYQLTVTPRGGTPDSLGFQVG